MRGIPRLAYTIQNIWGHHLTVSSIQVTLNIREVTFVDLFFLSTFLVAILTYFGSVQTDLPQGREGCLLAVPWGLTSENTINT